MHTINKSTGTIQQQYFSMISRRIFIALIAFPRLFLHAETQVATPERRQVFGLPCAPALLLLDGPQGPQISASATSYVDILQEASLYLVLFGVIVYLMIPQSKRSNFEKWIAEHKYVIVVFTALKFFVEIFMFEDSLSEYADLLKKSNNTIIENFRSSGPSSTRLPSRTCDEASSSCEDTEEITDVTPDTDFKEQSPIIGEYLESSSLSMCPEYNSSIVLKAAAESSLIHSSVQEDVELLISKKSAGVAPEITSTSAFPSKIGDITFVSPEECAAIVASDTNAVLGSQHYSDQSSEEQDMCLCESKYPDVFASEDGSSSSGLDNKHSSSTSVSADSSRANIVVQAEVGELGTGQLPNSKSYELKTCSNTLESHVLDSCSPPDRKITSAHSRAPDIFNEHTAQSQVSEVVLDRDCNVDLSEGTSCLNPVRSGTSSLSEMPTTINANALGRARCTEAGKGPESTKHLNEPLNEIHLESTSPNVSSCSSVSKYRTAPNPPATLAFSGSTHSYEKDSRGDSIVELRFSTPNGDILRKESVNILAGDEHMLLGMESMNILNERNSRCNGHRSASPPTTPKNSWKWFKSNQ